jgi:hypothetical protein
MPTRCPVHDLELIDGRCLAARWTCDSCNVVLDEAFVCPGCGVVHGDRCASCGHRGYHLDGCPESDATAEAAPGLVVDGTELAHRGRS